MNWRSPRLGLAFLLSFSGCSCEWHAGSSSSFSTSGGEQVIVFQDPEGDAQARAAQEQRERERAAQRAREPRRAGDSSKSIHVGGTPPGAGQAAVPVGSVPPSAAGPASIGAVPASPPSAAGPASIGATPTPTFPTFAPTPGAPPSADPAPVAQPTPAPVAQPTPAPVAQPTPAPAPAPAAPAAPAPAPGDTYVPARHPGTRPPSSGGAVTAGDPAQDQKKAPAQPVAPPRSR